MAAAGLVIASTLAWPQVRRGIAGGLTALAASNPWYENIAEFRPLVDAGRFHDIK